MPRFAFWLALTFPLVSFAGVAPDADGDGIPDALDRCSADSRNVTLSCDSDVDGYGNPCDPDFNQDFSVAAVDFGMFFVPKFKGGAGGAKPGPSGLGCAGVPGCQ